MNEIETAAPATVYGLAAADAVEAAKRFFRENSDSDTFVCLVAEPPAQTQVMTSREWE